jgi:hypothetical protein
MKRTGGRAAPVERRFSSPPSRSAEAWATAADRFRCREGQFQQRIFEPIIGTIGARAKSPSSHMATPSPASPFSLPVSQADPGFAMLPSGSLIGADPALLLERAVAILREESSAWRSRRSPEPDPTDPM